MRLVAQSGFDIIAGHHARLGLGGAHAFVKHQALQFALNDAAIRGQARCQQIHGLCLNAIIFLLQILSNETPNIARFQRITRQGHGRLMAFGRFTQRRGWAQIIGLDNHHGGARHGRTGIQCGKKKLHCRLHGRIAAADMDQLMLAKHWQGCGLIGQQAGLSGHSALIERNILQRVISVTQIGVPQSFCRLMHAAAIGAIDQNQCRCFIGLQALHPAIDFMRFQFHGMTSCGKC